MSPKTLLGSPESRFRSILVHTFYLFVEKAKMKNTLFLILLVIISCRLGANAQDIEIHFNKNIELFGYIIEMGDPSENYPSLPISIEINRFPEDRKIPALKELFELGENLDYSTAVELMYYMPEFPQQKLSVPIDLLQKMGFQTEEDQALIQSILEKVNQFSIESNFEQVWSILAKHRNQTVEILNAHKPSSELMSELEGFYGQSYQHYEIVPSLTIWSGAGWGFKNINENKSTFVLGPLDNNYDFTSDRFTSLSIHEFGHSFVNHIVEENGQIITETSGLFRDVEASMRRQGYSNWTSCVIEHFVRAGEVIIPEIMGDSATSQSNLQNNINERDFIYLEYIVARLKEYRLDKKLPYSVAVKNTLKDFQNKFQPKEDKVSTIKGFVRMSDSNEPIPFVHIGVQGKNLGTISRPDGSYEIDLSQTSAQDSLVFSSIGFKRASFVISELTESFDVSLLQEVKILKEVVVTGKKQRIKTEKFGRIKPSKMTRGQNGLLEFGFGGEQGIRINTSQTYYLEEVSFHMRFNTVDSVLFRINIYDICEDGLPSNSLLNRNIFVKSKKGQKWIRKRLEDERLMIDQDIIITYEVVQVWFNEKSNNAIFLTYGKGYPEGGVYLRRSSMDKWITEEPDAFPITLYVSGKVY